MVDEINLTCGRCGKIIPENLSYYSEEDDTNLCFECRDKLEASYELSR